MLKLFVRPQGSVYSQIFQASTLQDCIEDAREYYLQKATRLVAEFWTNGSNQEELSDLIESDDEFYDVNDYT